MNSRVRTSLAAPAPWNEGEPRINAPGRMGLGVGSECCLPVPALGERPLEFRAEGLPEGLRLDPSAGVITGSVAQEGEHAVQITATNVHGTARKVVRLVAGEGLALTPPMGWNSWNCWGADVDAGKILRAADALVSSGLAAHGFNYVNIDDGWQGSRGGPFHALQGNGKFPDMEGLCRSVHQRGLRIGIYSTPWNRSYAGFPGGSEGERVEPEEQIPPYRMERQRYLCAELHDVEDARQWAAWGIDYLKYDWNPWQVETVERMRDALRASGRDIVYSLSNSAPFEHAADWARLANCWRTTGDIRDEWDNLSRIAFSQNRWTPYAGPGHWNDPDMLVVGRLGWGQVRENHLTEDEQITHITLWALLAAPLLIGCDLSALDDFTVRLLGNDEVLAVNQDPEGRQGHCLREIRRTDEQGRVTSHTSVYSRPLEGGDVAVGLVNRGDAPDEVAVDWEELGLEGARRVRDLWAQRDLGCQAGRLALDVPAHGAQLVIVRG